MEEDKILGVYGPLGVYYKKVDEFGCETIEEKAFDGDLIQYQTKELKKIMKDLKTYE